MDNWKKFEIARTCWVGGKEKMSKNWWASSAEGSLQLLFFLRSIIHIMVWYDKDKKGNNNNNNNNDSKLAQKEYKTRHDRVGKVIHREMCKKLKTDHTNKWYMHNPTSVLENSTHKLIWDFDIHTDHRISARRPDLIMIRKKKRICKIVDFAVSADHRIKLIENTRELKKKQKLWNVKVTIIPIVIGAFGTVTKGLLKRLENEWRPFKLQHYWEQPEYWEESWRLEETCCHSNSSEKLSAKTDMKNFQKQKHKLLWDFEIQTDYLISARRPGLITVNNNSNKKKRTCRIVDFTVSFDHRVKLKESEKKD